MEGQPNINMTMTAFYLCVRHYLICFMVVITLFPTSNQGVAVLMQQRQMRLWVFVRC